MYRIAIDEAEDNSFCVSQFVLEDPAMTHDYNGLDYMVQRSKVTKVSHPYKIGLFQI